MLIARDQAFVDVVVDKSDKNSCRTNAWRCDIKLDHDSAYYWKVRAVSAANRGDWSPVGIFMTEAVPSAVVQMTAAGLSTPSPSTMAVASSGSAPTQLVVPAITITSVPAATDSLQSMLNWLLIMMGVLLALTIGLILTVIYLFKKVGKT